MDSPGVFVIHETEECTMDITPLAIIDTASIVNVGLWVLGGIGTLIVTATILAWQASKLHSGVSGLQSEAEKLRIEIALSRKDMKDEVLIIHGRIDNHEQRIGVIEGVIR